MQAKAADQERSAHALVSQASWCGDVESPPNRVISRVSPDRSTRPPTTPRKSSTPDTPAHRADGPGVGHVDPRSAGTRHAAPVATRDDLRRLAMWLTVDEPQLRPVDR